MTKETSKETLEAMEEAREIVEERKQELRKDEAYRLAVIETKNEIKDWCLKRCVQNIKVNGTDKWNSDLEDLIDIL